MPKRWILTDNPSAGNIVTKKPMLFKDAKPSASVSSDIAQSKRWSAISGSGDADTAYKLATRDPVEAYKFVCMCDPSVQEEYAMEEEQEEEQEEGDKTTARRTKSNKSEPRCDGGKSCLCGKPAADFPDRVWVVSRAGWEKYRTQMKQADLRDPSGLDIYTFNDHFGYGMLEVVQNLLLDFNEAGYRNGRGWREQWAVTEALVLFLTLGDGLAMTTVDDGEMAEGTAAQIQRLFLTMLATLGREELLVPSSPVRNVGLVMAMYVKLADTFRKYSLMPAYRETGSRKVFRFCKSKFDRYIAMYAREQGIELRGVKDLDVPSLDGVVMPKDSAKDPWSWTSTLGVYKRNCFAPTYAFRGWARQQVGGDGLDISSWSKKEIEEHRF